MTSPRNRPIKLAALLLALVLCLAAGGFAAFEPLPQETTSPATTVDTVASNSDSPALSFKNASKLQDHFEKHGWETNSETADEYLAGANAVIANPASLHKIQAADGDDAYFLESTGEFVVVSQAGYIRTYFITDRDYFDRQ